MLIAIPQFLIGQKFQSTIGITLLSYLFFIIYTRSSRRVLLEGIFKFIIESFNFKTGIKLKWNVEDVPDMTGKVVIITGGNTGTTLLFSLPRMTPLLSDRLRLLN